MNRREFIALFGGAAGVWPLAAFGQQRSMPTVGFLFAGSLSTMKKPLDGFRQGLKETGYVVDQNVRVEYRDAEGQYARLPALAAELVKQRIAVLVAIGGITPAMAAKASTSAIPIVFSTGGGCCWWWVYWRD